MGGTVLGGHGCLRTYISGLLQQGDLQDVLALIAPCLLVVQNNVNGNWFLASGYLEVKS
jgi:hypothetical protein